MILKKLLKDTDVFVTNLPKTPREKLRLTNSIIRKINPRILLVMEDIKNNIYKINNAMDNVRGYLWN